MFIISDDPSVWGWWLLDIRRRTLHNFINWSQKVHIKLCPLSDMMESGRPWSINRSFKNSLVVSIAVSVSLEAMKWTRREKPSKIVLIELNPAVVVGRWDIKSISMDPQWRFGKGIGCGVPYGLNWLSLYCSQMRHPVKYALMSDNLIFQRNDDRRLKVFWKENCPWMEHHGRGTEYPWLVNVGCRAYPHTWVCSYLF